MLFRGKTIYTNKWVEGFLVIATDAFNSAEKIYFIFRENVAYHGFGGFDGIERVIPETVGQFTGLLDKNGKKIFEGDIVVCLYGDKTHLVEWVDTSCGFEPFSDSNENCGHCGGGLMPEVTKVVGNCIDNPELLKGGVENV